MVMLLSNFQQQKINTKGVVMIYSKEVDYFILNTIVESKGFPHVKKLYQWK